MAILCYHIQYFILHVVCILYVATSTRCIMQVPKCLMLNPICKFIIMLVMEHGKFRQRRKYNATSKWINLYHVHIIVMF